MFLTTRYHHKVQASSLLETIVAMVIMVLVFAYSVLVINNVMRNAYLGAKTKATIEMHRMLQDTKKNKTYVDALIQYQGYVIEKNVEVSKQSQAVYVIHLVLKDAHDQVIDEIKEQVFVNEQ